MDTVATTEETSPVAAVPSQHLKTSPTISKLFAALAKAQAAIENAAKDRENPHFKSRYADLASIWDACRGPLSANGLSIVQHPTVSPAGVRITTILGHESGEWMMSDLTMPGAATPQAIGSVITYARRYALGAIVGVAPEDDDGEGASGNRQTQQNTQQLRRPPQSMDSQLTASIDIATLLKNAKTRDELSAIGAKHDIHKTHPMRGMLSARWSELKPQSTGSGGEAA